MSNPKMPPPPVTNNPPVEEADFTLNKSDPLLFDLAYAESTSSTSMRRYLGYTSPNSEKGDGEYDVIYEVTCTVRNTEGQDEKEIIELYAAANETMQKWYRIATSVWNGEGYPPENDLGFWERQTQLLRRVGANHVTVWGNIVDKEGRFVGLTITDQTNMKDAVGNVIYQLWLYDETTAFAGNGTDLSPFGINPNNIRKTTAVDAELRRGTRFDKPNYQPANQQSAPTNTTVVECETIAELRGLDNQTYFKLKVGRIAWLPAKSADDRGMVIMNGYSANAQGDYTLETNSNIFMHGNRNGFELLTGDFAKLNVGIAEGGEVSLEKPMWATGIKRIGNTGRAYYEKVRLEA